MTYTCDVGYTLQGSNSRTCQSDEQWSGSLPQCLGALNLVLSYTYVIKVSINDLWFSLPATCTNPCLNGGTCTAPETCTCVLGWTGNQCETSKGISKPKCMLPCLCPTKLLDAFCVCILCSVHGLLLILQLSSPATDCGDPGTPTNSQRSLSSTTYNSVVTYTCDVGYTLQGSNSRTCQSDGQWSESVPQCQRMFLTCILCCTN